MTTLALQVKAQTENLQSLKQLLRELQTIVGQGSSLILGVGELQRQFAAFRAETEMSVAATHKLQTDLERVKAKVSEVDTVSRAHVQQMKQVAAETSKAAVVNTTLVSSLSQLALAKRGLFDRLREENIAVAENLDQMRAMSSITRAALAQEQAIVPLRETMNAEHAKQIGLRAKLLELSEVSLWQMREETAELTRLAQAQGLVSRAEVAAAEAATASGMASKVKAEEARQRNELLAVRRAEIQATLAQYNLEKGLAQAQGRDSATRVARLRQQREAVLAEAAAMRAAVAQQIEGAKAFAQARNVAIAAEQQSALVGQAIEQQQLRNMRLTRGMLPELTLFTGGTKAAAVANYELHQALRGVSGGLGALWTTYGSMLPLIAGFAAVSGFKKATASGSEFAYQLAYIKGITQTSAEQMERLGEATLKLSRGTSLQGATQLAEGLRTLAKAGMEVQDALVALPNVMGLATIGELDLAKAAEIGVTAMQGYGLAASDMKRIADVLAAAASASATDVREIGEAFSYTGPLAATLGFSIEEVSALLADLAARAITGSKAGTSLTTMFLRMVAPTKQMQDAFRLAGVEIFDTENRLKSAYQILDDLSAKLGEWDEPSRLELIGRIFSVRSIKAASALLDSVSTTLPKMRAEIEKSTDGIGFMTKALLDVSVSTKGEFEKLKNTIEATFIESFEGAEPSIRQVLMTLRGIAADSEVRDGLTSIMSAISQTGVFLIEHLGTIANLVKWYAEWRLSLFGLSTLVGALGKYREVALAFNVARESMTLLTAATVLNSKKVTETIALYGLAGASVKSLATSFTLLRVVMGNPITWAAGGIIAAVGLLKSAHDEMYRAAAIGNEKDAQRHRAMLDRLEEEIAKVEERNAALRGDTAISVARDELARTEADLAVKKSELRAMEKSTYSLYAPGHRVYDYTDPARAQALKEAVQDDEIFIAERKRLLKELADQQAEERELTEQSRKSAEGFQAFQKELRRPVAGLDEAARKARADSLELLLREKEASKELVLTDVQRVDLARQIALIRGGKHLPEVLPDDVKSVRESLDAALGDTELQIASQKKFGTAIQNSTANLVLMADAQGKLNKTYRESQGLEPVDPASMARMKADAELLLTRLTYLEKLKEYAAISNFVRKTEASALTVGKGRLEQEIAREIATQIQPNLYTGDAEGLAERQAQIKRAVEARYWAEVNFEQKKAAEAREFSLQQLAREGQLIGANTLETVKLRTEMERLKAVEDIRVSNKTQSEKDTEIAAVNDYYGLLLEGRVVNAVTDYRLAADRLIETRALDVKMLGLQTAALADNAKEQLRNVVEADRLREQLRIMQSDSPFKAEEIQKLNDWSDALLRAQLRNLEASRSLGTGWARAWRTYEDSATNAAQHVETAISNATRNMSDAILEFTKTGKADIRDMVDSAISDFIRMQWETKVLGPLAGALGNFGFGDLFPNAGAQTLPASTIYDAVPAAHGRVFDSPDLSSLSGRIMTGPTVFSYKSVVPFASGAGLGGEAGYEAVMPLNRGPGNKLGVNATGIGATNVTIINKTSGQARTEETKNASGGRDILVIIDEALGSLVNSGRGKLSSALVGRGLRPSVAGR